MSLLFFVITLLAGRYLFPWVGNLTQRFQIKHVEFSMLLGWALAFSALAEFLDMHFILGAYAAGLFFTRRTIDKVVPDDLYHKLETVSGTVSICNHLIGESPRPQRVVPRRQARTQDHSSADSGSSTVGYTKYRCRRYNRLERWLR